MMKKKFKKRKKLERCEMENEEKLKWAYSLRRGMKVQLNEDYFKQCHEEQCNINYGELKKIVLI